MTLRVGLHAPYTWDEATQLACEVGDLGRDLACDVGYRAYQSREQGVRFDWDDVVDGPHADGFPGWAARQEWVVWADPRPVSLEQARKAGCRNALLLQGNRVNPGFRPVAPLFDVVVCPSEALAGSAQAALPRKVRLVTAPWGSGRIPPAPRSGPCRPGRLQLAVLLDGSGIRVHAPVLLPALQAVLSTRAEVCVELLRTSRWPGRASAALASELASRFPGRFADRSKPGRQLRHRLLLRSDWALVLPGAPGAGFDALEALSAGCPVVAPEVPPYTELVFPGHNGLLVPCRSEVNWLGAHRVALSAPVLAEALARADVHRLDRLSRSWHEFDSRRRAFRQVWRGVWGC